MSRKKTASLVVALTLSAGAMAPATGVAAKKRSAASPAPLGQLCKALGLDKLLGGTEANLAPVVRLRLLRICEG